MSAHRKIQGQHGQSFVATLEGGLTRGGRFWEIANPSEGESDSSDVINACQGLDRGVVVVVKEWEVGNRVTSGGEGGGGGGKAV